MSTLGKILLVLLAVLGGVALYWVMFRQKTAQMITTPTPSPEQMPLQMLQLSALASSLQANQTKAVTEPTTTVVSGGIDSVGTYADLTQKSVTKPTLINVENDEKTGRIDVLYYKTANVQRQQADVEYAS